MQKILAIINDKDRDKGIFLSSLLDTYKTILQIDNSEISRNEVERKMAQTQDALNSFWSNIADEYEFPLYLDVTMKINYDNNTVYIDA